MFIAPKSTSYIDPLAFEATVDSLYWDFYPRRGAGRVADYIPALAQVDGSSFGVAAQLINGSCVGRGDYQHRFSIQSVSKLFAFTMAFAGRGDRLWKRLTYEPAGISFNSLVQLEAEEGIPRNPFINAGAMVISDILLDDYADPTAEMLAFLRRLTGVEDLSYDEEVYRSELETGNRNAALAYLMKSFGNIHHHVDDVLATYFQQCSITMSCEQLAQAVQFLANQGVNPLTGRPILSPSQTKRTNALLLTTGLYNGAGDFAFRVGIPAKSGVGGGIAGIIPGYLSVVTWSPGLNSIGNSELGIDFLEEFTTRTGLSIF
ncbi:MAG: glutaminase [Bacteroidetes bacterium]|nr:MAG: glutaminase [Bacteroidota bacterium]